MLRNRILYGQRVASSKGASIKFHENSVELYAERVNNRGLCAIAQAESLRYKLLGGLAVRRACYGVLRFVMENGAKGCEVYRYMVVIFIISGGAKL
ncbi:putative ribosomal protein S3 domain superfamily [Helianthus annuus]|nr:putative ribosomal protein S3 domain superfamily [Helianthus annuus]